jgi:hypothetical protein
MTDTIEPTRDNSKALSHAPLGRGEMDRRRAGRALVPSSPLAGLAGMLEQVAKQSGTGSLCVVVQASSCAGVLLPGVHAASA